jgi:hypothetical protein
MNTTITRIAKAEHTCMRLIQDICRHIVLESAFRSDQLRFLQALYLLCMIIL